MEKLIKTEDDNTLMALVRGADTLKDVYDKIDENILRAAQMEELGFKAVAEGIMEEINFKDKMNRIALYKYLRITEEKIGKFLDKKVEIYNREHAGNKEEGNRYGIPSLVSWRHSIENPFLDQSFGDHLTFDKLAIGFDRAMSEVQSPSHRYWEDMQREIAIQQARHRLLGDILVDYSFDTTPRRVVNPEVETITRKTKDFNSSGNETIGRFEWTEEPISGYKAIPPADVLDKLKEHKDRKIFDYFTIASVNAVPDPLLLGRVKGCTDRFFIAQWGKDIALEDVL